MKNTQLVSCLGPDLGQHSRIQVGAVADHDLGRKAPILEVVQEAAHVLLVVGPHQGEGHREIVYGVGGQQQGAVTEVNFVDAQGAGEVFQAPLAIARHLDLADFPVEAVVQKAIGEIEIEIALEGLAQPFHAHAVVEQAVDDRIADAVGVFRARLDPLHLSSEGLATGAAGAVFSDFDFEQDDFAIGDIANAAAVNILAASFPAAMRTGKGLRGVREAFHANARLRGIHACVPPGLCA